MEINDIYEILQQVTVRESIVTCYTELRNYLNSVNRNLDTSENDFQESYEFIINDALQWSGVIKPFGFYNSKSTPEHYIEVDYYITPQKFQFKSETPQKELLNNLINKSSTNLLIFGKPGMGKTTSMKMVTQKLFKDKSFLENYFRIPFIIRLRELKDFFDKVELRRHSKDLIYFFIYRTFNLKISILDEEIEENHDYIPFEKNLVIRILDRLKIVLIIDGYDELASEIRPKVLAQIKEISLKCRNAKILVTSRTGELNNSIEGFDYFEIAALSPTQIELFVSKWLNKEKGKEFLINLEKSTFSDTAMKPLILSFLCTIYEFSGELPNKPKFLYREIIDLLISKWDRERGFGRNTKFKGFDKNAKLDFMTNLAFHLVMKSLFKFSKHNIKIAYSENYDSFGLPKDGYQEVIDEIEEHSGLFIQSGVDSYEFPHKSLQEFLASEYLVRYYPLEDFKNNIINLPHELAIVVALSKNPNNKLIEILNIIARTDFEKHNEFIKTFLLRLESEEPNFKVEAETAIQLSKIWEQLGYEGLGSIEKFNYAVKLYGLKGISKCYEKMDSYYQIDSKIIKNMMHSNVMPLKDDLLILTPKNIESEEESEEESKKEPIKVYFNFLENWKYIRPFTISKNT